MTADQRLDQLEPLVSQTLAVVDRHTAQLKKLVDIGIRQSANLEFAMRQLDEFRQEVRTDLDELKHKMGGIQQNQSLTSTRIGDVENAISLVGMQVTSLDANIDRLLGLLSSGK